MNLKNDLKIKEFASSIEFEEWIEQNHHSSPGIWLRYYKKTSDISSLNYDEVIDVALCYGWIDSQVHIERIKKIG